jgi:hypothetical protein
MTGIQYVTDAEGRKVAVQIDLREHAELWEEIEDVLISESRRNEESIRWTREGTPAAGCGAQHHVSPCKP